MPGSRRSDRLPSGAWRIITGMAKGRDYKVGLDYFELYCHLDDEVKLVQAEYGLKAFAVIVKLWQKI